MSNPCLPKAAVELTGQIDGAKAAADGLIGDATASVTDLITAQTDGIKGKLDALVPEIELPQANLQDQMTEMLSATGDPGAMVTKFAELKKNFGGAIDLDSVMAGVGLDAAKLNSLDSQLSEAIAVGASLRDKATDAIQSALPTGGAAGDKLKSIAGGAESAISGLLGETPDIGDAAGALESVCKKIPNVDLDAAGNIIKKGIPVDLPSLDAAILEATSELKDAASITPVIKKLDAAKENTTMSITAASPERAEAVAKWNERIKANHENIASKAAEKKAIINKLKRSAIAPDVSLMNDFKSYKYWQQIDMFDADAQKEQTFKSLGIAYDETKADFPFISRSVLNDKCPVASIRASLEAGLESEVKINEET
jgi:hypothetical protein